MNAPIFFFNYYICSTNVVEFFFLSFFLLVLFFFFLLYFITLELRVLVSILYVPPGVQVLSYLGSIPRSGTTGSQTGFPRCRQTVPCRRWASFLPWHSFAAEVAVLLDLMLLWVPLNSYPPNSREVEGSRKFEFKAREGISLWGGRNSTGDLESSVCLCQMVNSSATAIPGWL